MSDSSKVWPAGFELGQSVGLLNKRVEAEALDLIEGDQSMRIEPAGREGQPVEVGTEPRVGTWSGHFELAGKFSSSPILLVNGNSSRAQLGCRWRLDDTGRYDLAELDLIKATEADWHIRRECAREAPFQADS